MCLILFHVSLCSVFVFISSFSVHLASSLLMHHTLIPFRRATIFTLFRCPLRTDNIYIEGRVLFVFLASQLAPLLLFQVISIAIFISMLQCVKLLHLEKVWNMGSLRVSDSIGIFLYKRNKNAALFPVTQTSRVSVTFGDQCDI